MRGVAAWLRRVGAAAALIAALVALAACPAAAAPAPDPVPRPTLGQPWFGPSLDWSRQTATSYADRLGRTPSLYEHLLPYPLSDQDVSYLDEFAAQVASQGSVDVLTLEPQQPLAALTEADATRLATEIATLHRRYDSYVLIRFAPEMNGSWETWGQQPAAYVSAFRRVAAAVHAATDQAAMVWSPAYGAGYPFGSAVGHLDLGGSGAALDTNGDGQVTDADDPYGPYYPGDDAVDWVGLSLYYFGAAVDSSSFRANTKPSAGAYQQRLAETAGYGSTTSRSSFYDRFAQAHAKPMLVETGALFEPGVKGASEQTIKRDWWRQVLGAEATHPLIEGISWLELTRDEAEVGNRSVDWEATHTSALAHALSTDLDTYRAHTGAVTDVLDLRAADRATTQANLPHTDSVSAEMGWICLCAIVLAAAYCFAGFAGRFIPSWRYPNEHDPRDRRVDLFRGWIILAVVITHIEVGGLYSFVTLNAIGAITGAEMFVLLSGLVLGMVYPGSIRRFGQWPAVVSALRRVRKLYLVSLAVILIVYVLGKIPGIDASVITTFTDRGTGSNGASAAGHVYNLYPNAPRLFDYPPPWYALKEFLLLQMGPWVFNIMGLFVVLSLVLPALMWLIMRRLWWAVLAVSWGLFVYAAHAHPHWPSSQFEDVFPLLTWQIAFTHGLVVGYYRRQIIAALTSLAGKIVSTIFVLGYALALGWLWLAHRTGIWSPYHASFYGWAYSHLYVRVFLQAGRLLDLVLMTVVAFAFLTTVWKPVARLVGWLWIPLGEASLYVFVMHVFLVLAVGNIPGLDRTNWWQGTLIHTAVIMLLWVMVKRRFLFKVIPR